jgi:hypothetical protein
VSVMNEMGKMKPRSGGGNHEKLDPGGGRHIAKCQQKRERSIQGRKNEWCREGGNKTEKHNHVQKNADKGGCTLTL